MSIPEAQSLLTLSIEAVALASALFFPVAIAAELVAGFRRHRSRPAAVRTTSDNVRTTLVNIVSTAEPETVSKVAPMAVPVAAVAVSSPDSVLPVVPESVPVAAVAPPLAMVAFEVAIAAVAAEIRGVRLAVLRELPLSELRDTAAALKLRGRAKLKTKAALVAALSVA